MKTLTTKDICSRYHTDRNTLHQLVIHGLIRPADPGRGTGSKRLFTPEDLKHLPEILLLKRYGMTLGGIKRFFRDGLAVMEEAVINIVVDADGHPYPVGAIPPGIVVRIIDMHLGEIPADDPNAERYGGESCFIQRFRAGLLCPYEDLGGWFPWEAEALKETTYPREVDDAPQLGA